MTKRERLEFGNRIAEMVFNEIAGHRERLDREGEWVPAWVTVSAMVMSDALMVCAGHGPGHRGVDPGDGRDFARGTGENRRMIMQDYRSF